MQERSVKELREDVFEKIIALNQDRIVARIRAAFGMVPGFRPGGQSDLRSDSHLETIITSLQCESSRQSARVLVRRLRDIRKTAFDLATEFRGRDESHNAEKLSAMRLLAKDCYLALTEDGSLPFQDVLKHAGLSSEKWVDKKELVQLDKIGSYYRIARTLALIFGSKTRLRGKCNKLTLKPCLVPYEPVPITLENDGESFNCYTHAEVQLMVQLLCYQERSCHPRVMGGSKLACYLCYLFLKSVDQIQPPPTHRQVAKKWYIPDLQEYRPAQVRVLRTAISRMNSVISSTAKRKFPWNRYALTSRPQMFEMPTSIVSSVGTPVGKLSSASVTDRNDPNLREVTEEPADLAEKTEIGEESRAEQPDIIASSEAQHHVANVSTPPSPAVDPHSISDRPSSRSAETSETSLNTTDNWTALSSNPVRLDSDSSVEADFYLEVENPAQARARYVQGELPRGKCQTVVVSIEDLQPGIDVEVERPDSEKTLLLDVRVSPDRGSMLELQWLSLS